MVIGGLGGLGEVANAVLVQGQDLEDVIIQPHVMEDSIAIPYQYSVICIPTPYLNPAAEPTALQVCVKVIPRYSSPPPYLIRFMF